MHFCFCLFAYYFPFLFSAIWTLCQNSSCKDIRNNLLWTDSVSVTQESFGDGEDGDQVWEASQLLSQKQPCLVFIPARNSAMSQWLASTSSRFPNLCLWDLQTSLQCMPKILHPLTRYIESRALGCDWSQCRGNMLECRIVSDRLLLWIY